MCNAPSRRHTGVLKARYHVWHALMAPGWRSWGTCLSVVRRHAGTLGAPSHVQRTLKGAMVAL